MVRKKATAICVPLKQAEPLRRLLRNKRLLREDLQIHKDKEHMYLPVKETPEELQSYKLVKCSFEEKKLIPRSYKEILEIPRQEKALLPTSYDIVGDSLLIKIPKELVKYQQDIGRALLTTHRNVRSVCRIDPVAGELRTRAITVIAGEQQTRTLHTEYGLSFAVDIQTAYFSPRLASERRRVASLVKPGEIVVDMFAGVAPFSIMIARYAHPKRVYAIDKNEDAVALAKENVKKNRVLETVEVIHADAQDLQSILPVKADRIIMNLPFSAHEFFSSALSIAAKRCTLHYYDILKEEGIPPRIEELKKMAYVMNFFLAKCAVRTIKTYAPREFYIGIDITATASADVA